MVFTGIIFFAPELGGYFLEYNNFIPADPLKTPPHIAPVWYFTPYYSMLRATTSAFMPFLWLGLLAVGLINLRDSALKIPYLAVMAVLFFLFGVPAVVLGWVGM